MYPPKSGYIEHINGFQIHIGPNMLTKVTGVPAASTDHSAKADAARAKGPSGTKTTPNLPTIFLGTHGFVRTILRLADT